MMNYLRQKQHFISKVRRNNIQKMGRMGIMPGSKNSNASKLDFESQQQLEYSYLGSDL